MEGLFYSNKEQRLFWIPNYYTHGTGKLENLLENLKEGEIILRNYVPHGEISCDQIQTSRRYKHMWYFAVSATPEQAKDAFQLGPDWTMWAWITN